MITVAANRLVELSILVTFPLPEGAREQSRGARGYAGPVYRQTGSLEDPAEAVTI
jgi:hypothetical protein